MLQSISNVSITLKTVEKRSCRKKSIYKGKGVERPHYQGDLPAGNSAV
jgi:hypothetical protein